MTMLLHNIIDFSHYRSILCLNGDLPDAEFYNTHLPIIAADGAANTLIKAGVDPHAIVGDLDSVSDHIKSRYETVHDENQDTNDYQKSLAFLQQHNLLPTIVTGVHGGYLDHVLNNINIFLQTDSILYAPPVVGMVVRKGDVKSLALPANTKISLLGFPKADVTSSGLKWELQHYPLAFPGKNSCFNRVRDGEVTVTVHDGLALLLIYLEEMTDAGI